jgi:tRNA 2-thiouridine synthesizing protein B
MPTLHTVRKSPFERNALASCLRVAQPGAAVLLIEDGVYAALRNTQIAEQISKAMETVSFYALAPDVQARGYELNEVIDGVQIVDYDGFVDLVATYGRVQAWP